MLDGVLNLGARLDRAFRAKRLPLPYVTQELGPLHISLCLFSKRSNHGSQDEAGVIQPSTQHISI